MNVQLQPLRITAGWTVSYNSFHAVDATLQTVTDNASFLNEDLLQLRHARFDRLLDLGWTPERNFEDGQFHLQIYETDFHGKDLYNLRSKDRNLIVAEIERLCAEISNGNF